ncbi:MAG: ribbon-helix-helix domain-containing protein [Proteobacteria bacterium]|nr:ribbon-helix-helix domain-containing protein [Pseudomonadota bacterium]
MAEGTEAPTPAMRQQIVQAEGRRYSLKLEPAFWAALERSAKLRGVRRGRLVADIAKDLTPGANLASRLRVFCLEEAQAAAHEQEQRAVRALLAVGETDVAALTEACPVPCLIAGQDRVVARVNSAFGRWFGPSHAKLVGRPIDHFLKLKTVQPFEGIMASFAERRLAMASGHLIYVVPGRVIAAPARMVPVARSDAQNFAVLIMVAEGRG